MKLLERFSLAEMTFQRIAQGFKRRIVDLPHSIAWSIEHMKKSRYHMGILEISNKHQGERCFILANGPSLGKMDLMPLSNEYFIGLNRIYLLFERLPKPPDYYVAVNELVLDQFHKDICAISSVKFINWNRRQLFEGMKNTLFVKLSYRLKDTFIGDITRPISSGGTVTFVALQIAFYLGFKEVILIGLDHSFQDKGTPNKIETRFTQEDKNHFAPNYFPQGTKWQLPDLKRSELAYIMARRAYEANGRKIVDATPEGKCQVFEKVDYHSLF